MLMESLLIKGACAVLEQPEGILDYDIMTNANPRIKRYSIIGAEDFIYQYLEQPDGYDDRGGPGGGELIDQQLYPIRTIIGLGDGTFIASRGNFVLSFDSNLQTKFRAKRDVKLTCDKIIKGNFFVLPYEKIEELYKEVAFNNDHAVQELHDELLLYLYPRPENK